MGNGSLLKKRILGAKISITGAKTATVLSYGKISDRLGNVLFSTLMQVL